MPNFRGLSFRTYISLLGMLFSSPSSSSCNIYMCWKLWICLLLRIYTIWSTNSKLRNWNLSKNLVQIVQELEVVWGRQNLLQFQSYFEDLNVICWGNFFSFHKCCFDKIWSHHLVWEIYGNLFSLEKVQELAFMFVLKGK